jgi:uncharacterized membrane protein YfcA
MFASAGVLGAFGGSTLGKAMDGDQLLLAFAVLMVLVGAMMLKQRGDPGNPDVRCARENAPKVLGFGLATGLFSGFFGIGGGFLIVPGLLGATAMPLINAIGSSLVSVTAFGATTATSYALSGLVDWRIAGLFVLGGAIGGVTGLLIARRLSGPKPTLSYIFAGVVIATGLYVCANALR